jgi:tetratricopeptide (TPR) repeat protein/DNA-binding transcriptional ArsR family regulator
MSPETLEKIFVQREDIAQDLVDRIILSATTPAKHHSLLIGARGMGKTHLVSLVYYRLEQHQELADKLMVAWMREDEWGIDSWLDLVVRIFRALGEAKDFPERLALSAAVGIASPLAIGSRRVNTKELLAQLQQVSIADAETLATQLLTELIGDKTLLLIVENLDDLFAGLGEKGQQKFRSFLQERQCCTILATTPALFAGVQNRSEPFFGFFNPIPLSPLSKEEAAIMLQKIAELEGQTDLANFLRTPAGKARVRAVHHLAGGNPRVYTLFSQFITRESLDELVQAFMKMLDDLTPYYQSRMKELSNQQRKIIEFLVDRREAVMVKEIASYCFVEQRVVSGQLLQLRNKGYVVARANGRESFYELTEVLMRLCMEVKKYRGQWVELFVDFLRIWYRPAERQEKLAMLRGNGGLISDEHLELVLMSDADPVLLVVSREFKNCLEQKNLSLALQLLVEVHSIGGINEEQYQQINKLINAGELDEISSILDRTVNLDSSDTEKLLMETLKLEISGRWEEALDLFDRILAIEPNNVRVLFGKGCLLSDLDRYEEAISIYDRAVQLEPESYNIRHIKDILLCQLGRYEEAIASFERAIEFKPDLHDAWYNRGVSLGNLGRYEEAIASYQRAIEFKPDLHDAWYNRGVSLGNLGRYEEAIASYERAIEFKPDLHQAWYNRGNSLFNLGRYEEAIASYQRAIEFKPDKYDAWNSRGNSLFNLGRYEEAIASYQRAIEFKPDYHEAWYNRGNSLGNLGRYEEAIASYQRAIEFKPDYHEAWNNLGNSLDNLGRYEEAIASYQRAIEFKPDKYEAWHNQGWAFFKWGKQLKSIDCYDRAIEIKPDNYNSWHGKGVVLFSMGNYSEALTTWQQTFNIIHQSTDRPYDVANLIQEFLEELIPKFTQPAVKTMLIELVQTYIQTSVLTELGTALVLTLKQILAPDISNYTAQKWLELWQELLGDKPEMQLPFRLMNTAILYKQHPDRKERLWLGLASEERGILDDALA